ncbi:MAG: hypothetical protein AABX51_08505 [Nanoarchaeota archaeon]
MRFLFWGKESPENELKKLVLEHQKKREQLEKEKGKHPEKADYFDGLIKKIEAHYNDRIGKVKDQQAKKE